MFPALRHAPPQRVLFQPDVSTPTPRQTRQSTGALNNSPQPGTTTNAYGTSEAAVTIANYQPRTAVPSTMKPVVTPATNPDYFKNLRNRYLMNRQGRSQPFKGMMLPGSKRSPPVVFSLRLHHISWIPGAQYLYSRAPFIEIRCTRGRSVCAASYGQNIS